MHEPFRDPERQPRFMRFYCCLGPLKKGFLAACRPLIGVDGCHLKGPYRGQLLTTVAVDANNGWWPIAYAVVEKEATEQWKWFFELLQLDLDIPNKGYAWTFIFDRQKVNLLLLISGHLCFLFNYCFSPNSIFFCCLFSWFILES